MAAVAAEPAVVTPGLFEKSPFSIGRRTPSSEVPRAAAYDKPSSGSPLGNFLSRLFPTGDFLDRLAQAERRDGESVTSYYKGRSSSSSLLNGDKLSLSEHTAKALEHTAKAKAIASKAIASKAIASKAISSKAISSKGLVTPLPPKARETRAASIDAITGLPADDMQASAVQLRQELKAKKASDAASAAEERKRRIVERAEQADKHKADGLKPVASNEVFSAIFSIPTTPPPLTTAQPRATAPPPQIATLAPERLPSNPVGSTPVSTGDVTKATEEIRETQQRQLREGAEKERQRQQQVELQPGPNANLTLQQPHTNPSSKHALQPGRDPNLVLQPSHDPCPHPN